MLESCPPPHLYRFLVCKSWTLSLVLLSCTGRTAPLRSSAKQQTSSAAQRKMGIDVGLQFLPREPGRGQEREMLLRDLIHGLHKVNPSWASAHLSLSGLGDLLLIGEYFSVFWLCYQISVDKCRSHSFKNSDFLAYFLGTAVLSSVFNFSGFVPGFFLAITSWCNIPGVTDRGTENWCYSDIAKGTEQCEKQDWFPCCHSTIFLVLLTEINLLSLGRSWLAQHLGWKHNNFQPSKCRAAAFWEGEGSNQLCFGLRLVNLSVALHNHYQMDLLSTLLSVVSWPYSASSCRCIPALDFYPVCKISLHWFSLRPLIQLLWSKFPRGLFAGKVQHKTKTEGRALCSL